jgi:hypothetical protein
MINVLLIADQPRLHDLFQVAESQPEISLKIVTDLAQADIEVTTVAPAAIFIQDHFCGLSGAIISRHFRNCLLSSETRIIVFAGSDEDQEDAIQRADLVLDVGRTDEALISSISNILVELQFGRDESKLTSKFQQEMDTKTPSPMSLHDLETLPDHFDCLVKEPTSQLHNRNWPHWKVFLLLAFFLGISFYSYSLVKSSVPNKQSFSLTPAPRTSATTPQQTTSTASSKQTKPPSLSFLNNAKVDSRYGTSHPGWERYLTSSIEYRVFRDKGNIKALQVIGRSGASLSTEMVKKVVREITGATNYNIDSKAEEGDYFIEKGIVPPKGKLILYRRKPEQKVNALVIYLQ